VNDALFNHLWKLNVNGLRFKVRGLAIAFDFQNATGKNGA
jgi:hypothetical protein